MKTCNLCSNKYYAKGYCLSHYAKQRKASNSVICSVFECNKKVHTLKSGLCRGHHIRKEKGTEVNTPLRVHDSSQGCQADGCEEKHYSHGYCKLHDSRYRRGGDLYRSYAPRDGSQGCFITDCQKKHYGLGYCLNHYGRVNREKRKQALIEQFGGKCSDCKGEFPSECFDFDNVVDGPGHVQIGRLLSRNAPEEAIQSELSRCQLVCANCHRIRTRSRYGSLD